MSFLAKMVGSFFSYVADNSSSASLAWFWDEPKCPKSLIK